MQIETEAWTRSSTFELSQYLVKALKTFFRNEQFSDSVACNFQLIAEKNQVFPFYMGDVCKKTSKMRFTNNRLTGVRTDKTLLGSTGLSGSTKKHSKTTLL